jgi:hypothetical protein
VLANEEEHTRLVETARGDRPADLFVRGPLGLLDVKSSETLAAAERL